MAKLAKKGLGIESRNGAAMKLQDAIEQYAEMVMLGSEAVTRLVAQEADCPNREELSELIAAVVVAAERVRSASCVA